MEYYLDSFDAVDNLESLIRGLRHESWKDEEAKESVILGIKMSIDRLRVMSDRAPKYNVR